MSKEQYQNRFFIPFTRVFYRYRLCVANFSAELEAVRWIHNAGLLVGGMCGKPPNADLEDSRNIMEAFSTSMTYQPAKIPDCMGLLSYASKFVMPGCEDLVGRMANSAIQVVWNCISGPDPIEILFGVLALLLRATNMMLHELNPAYTDKQPCMDSLLANIFEADLMSLFLRLFLSVPTPYCESPESLNMNRAIQEFLELLGHIPNDHLRIRLGDSGTLRLWRKYLLYFGSSGLLSPSAPNVKHEECSYIITGVCDKLLDREWAYRMSMTQPVGVCGNARCPILVGAELSCSEYGTPYCDARCQGLGRIYGPPMSLYETEALCSTDPQVKAPAALFNPLIYVINTIWPESASST